MQSPYWYGFKQGYYDLSFYSFDLILGIVQSLSFIGINVFLWTYIIKIGDHQSIIERLSYFLLANGLATFLGGTWVQYGKEIRERIKSGLLTHYLLKPINTPLFIYAEQFGDRFAAMFTGALFVIAAVLIVPPPNVTGIFLFIVTFVCGMIISASFNLCVGSVAFWTTEASGISNVVGHMLRLLNGTQIKLSYITDSFGFLVGSIFYLLPFAATAFTPAFLLYSKNIGIQETFLIWSAVGWAVVLPIAASYVWKQGVKRYEGTGT